MQRYFFGFIATAALIVLLIFLIFHGGGKPKVPTTSKTLDSYAATNAEVSFTIDGPVNADQTHRVQTITVSNSTTTFKQIQGYQGSVIKQQTYPNNTNAYTNFLFALEHAGFTTGDTTSTLKDERGYCPLGNRYIVEIDQDGKQLERFWSTSCGKPKSYKGNIGVTMTLFENQIPDYNRLIQNNNL